jgi:hypothetical protein
MITLSQRRLDAVFLSNGVSNGVLTEAEIAARDRALHDTTFHFMSQALVSAWGRRPQ